MNQDLDRQSRQTGRWPWPPHDAVDIARMVAGMYRARLGALDKTAQQEADEVCRSYGQTWMLPALEIVDPQAAVTTAEAAVLVNRPPETIRKWACMDHPERPGEKLLPRFKRRGRERTYLAEHVLAAAAALRRADRLVTR